MRGSKNEAAMPERVHDSFITRIQSYMPVSVVPRRILSTMKPMTLRLLEKPAAQEYVRAHEHTSFRATR
jgi:hypothetical protein